MQERAYMILRLPHGVFWCVFWSYSKTAGKGSVSLKIATALRLLGYRVGLYTSPHISCFRERMAVDDQPITEDMVRRSVLKLTPVMSSHLMRVLKLTPVMSCHLISSLVMTS